MVRSFIVLTMESGEHGVTSVRLSFVLFVYEPGPKGAGFVELVKLTVHLPPYRRRYHI